ncbi:hypothetical protein A1O7_02619 [Cladophialophora yegresii CBS 114405]|uniref:Uncharacterized protein n=1 Tax=Cladophialophora yegresii CBS 114405 TaxID=1182544 RepID=W9WC96_9EURO|nr:uncharacterized protein A1O7_02619 [Cladophialophora yegresii CBS 114405]EXJ62186.1 hypothetical protein A1O7_02619 [Cladophialophora yegresii CBS 114405]
MIPLEKPTADTSSITSSQDSIAEAKAQTHKPTTTPGPTKNGLEFSVPASSVIQSLDQCSGVITIVAHNPTSRSIAFLLDGWDGQDFPWNMSKSRKSTFYHDMGVKDGQILSKYNLTIECFTLDLGRTGVLGRMRQWWTLFKDWECRTQVWNVAPGETRKLSVCNTLTRWAGFAEKKKGLVRLFKRKTYIAELDKDFTAEQWRDPDFRKSPNPRWECPRDEQCGCRREARVIGNAVVVEES